mgnify:CR=1 FL=1
MKSKKQIVSSGICFDSVDEMEFYYNLKSDKQVLSVDAHVDMPYIGKNGKKIFSLILDFVVAYKNGSIIYYDVKGYTTCVKMRNGKKVVSTNPAWTLFKLKRKLIEDQYGITIHAIVNGEILKERGRGK